MGNPGKDMQRMIKGGCGLNTGGNTRFVGVRGGESLIECGMHENENENMMECV